MKALRTGKSFSLETIVDFNSFPYASLIGSQVYSTGNFTCLEVVFVLKRRLGYYLFHTYIPTCLIVIMSVSVCSYAAYKMIIQIESSRCKFMLTERNLSIKVGIVLDQTRSSTGSCNIRCDLVTHTFYATCKIAGIAAARLLSESRRCIHVSLYHFCVYGIDGILFGEYCFGRYGPTEANTAAATTTGIKTIALFQFTGNFNIYR